MLREYTICLTCKGFGVLFQTWDRNIKERDRKYIVCPTCNGVGKIEITDTTTSIEKVIIE